MAKYVLYTKSAQNSMFRFQKQGLSREIKEEKKTRIILPKTLKVLVSYGYDKLP